MTRQKVKNEWYSNLGHGSIKKCSISVGGEIIESYEYCDKCKNMHQLFGSQTLETSSCDWEMIRKELLGYV